MTDKEFSQIYNIIGYEFKNEKLLETALTHSSFVNEHSGAVSNERLEFFGDTILGFVVSEELYKTTFLSEGKMTEIRKPYVCKSTLAVAMEKSGLLDFLQVGKGGYPLSEKTKSNVFEAVLASIYLDCGNFDEPRAFIKRTLGEIKMENFDPKSKLQEHTQSQKDRSLPRYKDYLNADGTWTSEVYIKDKRMGRATANSKIRAQKECAEKALKALKII